MEVTIRRQLKSVLENKSIHKMFDKTLRLNKRNKNCSVPKYRITNAETKRIWCTLLSCTPSVKHYYTFECTLRIHWSSSQRQRMGGGGWVSFMSSLIRECLMNRCVNYSLPWLACVCVLYRRDSSHRDDELQSQRAGSNSLSYCALKQYTIGRCAQLGIHAYSPWCFKITINQFFFGGGGRQRSSQ